LRGGSLRQIELKRHTRRHKRNSARRLTEKHRSYIFARLALAELTPGVKSLR
jgi:hypothetical protein